MRLSTPAIVLGAVSAAAGMEQHVLGVDNVFDAVKPKLNTESWMSAFEEKLSEMTSEAKAVWDEVTLLAPDAVKAFKKHALPSKPKPHTRRPDSEWDHIVKGADVQAMWVQKDGEKQRKIGGLLEDYNLRAKKVDPSKLGIDKVKQYSGYLDDEANDKHLFYCQSLFPTPLRIMPP
jgi:cathepsin A (carboxypeptidase C)